MQFRGMRWVGLVGAVALFACNTAELTPSPGGGTSSGDPVADGDAGADQDGGGSSSGGLVDPDGGAPIAVTHAVSIQIEPSDSGKAVEDAIKNAQKSVHMTMYLLSDSYVISSLKALHSAGKDVKVILNQNFPSGQGGANNTVFNSLKNAGVDVVWAPAGYTYTHSKSVIIDGTKLLVMTQNLTQTSADNNREYIATDTDADDIAEAEQVFQADYANKALTITGKLLLSPRSASSPDAQSRIKALIASAKSTLDLEGEELSDSVTVDALIASKQAGVTVRIVLDAGTPTAAQQDAVAKLKAAGVPLVAVSTPSIHAKAIVADGVLCYVGSMNFTANSLFNNREMGLITDAASEVAKVEQTFATDFKAGSAL